MKKSDLFFNVLRLPVDFLMLVSAGFVTYFFRTEIISAFRPVLFEFNLPLLRFSYLVFLVSAIFIGAYAASGLYSMRVRIRMLEEFSKIFIASSAGILMVIIYIFLRQEVFDSRFLIIGGWFFAVLFVFLGRLAVRYVQAVAVTRFGFGAHGIMIIGENDIASTLASEIDRDLSLGYRVAGKLDSPDMAGIRSFMDGVRVDEIVLANQNASPDFIADLISLCHEKHVIFKIIPGGSQVMSGNLEIDVFGGLPLIEIKRTNLDGWGRVIKRVVDVFGALLGLIILSPLFAVLAFAIKWETEGPVLARLKRISGRDEFVLLKFRSMVENAEELKPLLTAFNERTGGPLFKMKNDPRITGIGRLMRKFRLDELPQLWNVLRGEMSIVGPRPHQPDEIALYQRHHKKVLAIKAGATGLAQVSGSSDINFEKEVSLDSFYIDNWSLWLDMKIILRTALKMLSDRSAV